MNEHKLAALASIAHRLYELTEGEPSALEWVLPELVGFLDAEKALALRMDIVGGERLELDFLHSHGFRAAAMRDRMTPLIDRRPQDFTGWSPFAPLARDRNRPVIPARLFGQEAYENLPMYRDVYMRVGLGGHDTLRVLACEGPSVLAYIGVFRQEPFTERELACFRRAIPLLRRRLVLERDLGSRPLVAARLATAMEAIAAAAYLVRRDGAVVHANAAGRALLERGAREIRERLAAAVRGRAAAPFELTPIAARGAPREYLAVLRAPPIDPAARTAALAASWGLTGRRTQVLALLARGKTDKTIAAHFECSERSVRLHVEAILDRAQCGSRAEFVTKFWAGDGSSAVHGAASHSPRAAHGVERIEARVTHARERWQLSGRQAEVLRRLALGDANKDIADCLEMSTRTVEQHVADLLLKAGVDSRLRLIARLWTGI